MSIAGRRCRLKRNKYMGDFEIYVFPLNSDNAIDVTKITCPLCSGRMYVKETQYDEINAPIGRCSFETPINKTAGMTYITKCRSCQCELKIPTSNQYRYY